MQKVIVVFAGSNPYMIPEVLKEKFEELRDRPGSIDFNLTFEDYLYKRGEFDLYVEAKGIYSKYNTENALK